ncbi:MAG: aminoacetone oxidase family FAD-binding enzyme [Cyanobacteria bacterium]|nr:aminoacetone oxidase family FAD-binding enzyme [Cyanobacteriota bacterium]
MAPSCPAALPERVSLLVAGGGPAGFMAAIAAAEAGVRGVHLLEATPELLHKVRISGGGRCNVTHACWDPGELVGHYPRGGRALRGPFSRFASGDAVAWFADHGLALVEEADGRLFPQANRSSAVVACLRRAALAAGVTLHTGRALQGAAASAAAGFALQLRPQGLVQAERLVLATGSHPSGKRLAVGLGHTLIPPAPSLFTLALAGDPLLALAGVSMAGVGLSLEWPSGPPQRQRGAVLITHWGLSGPATLRLTAFAARDLQSSGYRARLRIDWTGGRSPAELEQWFQQARSQQARRQLVNWRPWPDLSRRLWNHLLERAGVEPSRRWADLGKGQQRQLIADLRGSVHAVTGRGPFGEEFVTAGGVPLGEVNLARMESRCQPGLHLVGELLDVDGVTGGFNFQHCWSSGWIAGQAAATELT